MQPLQVQWLLWTGALPLLGEVEPIQGKEGSGRRNRPIQLLEVLLRGMQR